LDAGTENVTPLNRLNKQAPPFFAVTAPIAASEELRSLACPSRILAIRPDQ
jgi:hypothetical protein